ncbi:hypothetical protein MMC25_004512 [Agyrium rufum]|nr:hypothetical protein [Agyrium rufum]
MQSTPPHRDAGRRVVEMMAKGKIKAVIDDVFDMEDALKAYDRLISRRAKGKLIVRINNLDDM